MIKSAATGWQLALLLCPVNNVNVYCSIQKWVSEHCFKAHLDLPKDSLTLFSTHTVAWAVAVKSVAGGSYYHFGLENGLASVINEFGITNSETVEFHINIYGLPLHRSTSAQFWPILGLVTNSKYSKPFMNSLYYGNCKPTDISEYINNFLSEYLELQATGIKCNNRTYQITLTAVICDMQQGHL